MTYDVFGGTLNLAQLNSTFMSSFFYLLFHVTVRH